LDEPTDSWPTTDRDTVVGAPPPAAPPPVPPPGPPADRRIGSGMLLAIGAILLVALGVLIAWLLTHRGNDSNSAPATTVVVTTGRATTSAKLLVPRVIGLEEDQALIRLGQVGLRANEVHRASKKPTGVVIAQNPREASEVKKGTRVTLIVDAAPKQKLTPATATATTSTSTTTTAPATTAPTTTTAPAPPPQPQNATMPDVQGQDEAAAVQSLGNAGILASLVFVPGDDTLGTIVDQAKPSGTSVPFHSHVQLNISRGPNNNPLESVPSVIGKTLKDAVSAMQSSQLRLIYLRYPVTSRAQAGQIVQQSPVGGGKAPQNAQVLVFLGSFEG
jgi:beta-lactam-binding protein with PASTA domain